MNGDDTQPKPPTSAFDFDAQKARAEAKYPMINRLCASCEWCPNFATRRVTIVGDATWDDPRVALPHPKYMLVNADKSTEPSGFVVFSCQRHHAATDSFVSLARGRRSLVYVVDPMGFDDEHATANSSSEELYLILSYVNFGIDLMWVCDRDTASGFSRDLDKAIAFTLPEAQAWIAASHSPMGFGAVSLSIANSLTCLRVAPNTGDVDARLRMLSDALPKVAP